MELATLARDFGLPLAMLIIALYTGSRGGWVFGREFTDVKTDRDFYRAKTFETQALLKDAIEHLERLERLLGSHEGASHA